MKKKIFVKKHTVKNCNNKHKLWLFDAQIMGLFKNITLKNLTAV